MNVVTLFSHAILPWALPVHVEEDVDTETARLVDAKGESVIEGLEVDEAEKAAHALNSYEEVLTHAVCLAEWAESRDPTAPTQRLKELIEASCFSRARRWTHRAQTHDLVRLDAAEWLVRKAWLDDDELWQVQLSPLIDGAPDVSQTRTVTQSGTDRCPLLVIGRMKAVYVRTA